jgi:hypothetical protein
MDQPETAAAPDAPAAPAPPAALPAPGPAAAPVSPPPRIEPLFASLSDEGRELVPVHLRLNPAPTPGDYYDARTVVSTHHRSRGYHCYPYHKPISRCLASDVPPPAES